MTDHFTSALARTDPTIAAALGQELTRQQNQIELIASENIVSRAVLDALGHEMTNKTLEGYPGARFHGGGQNVDIVEQAAIDRACQLFECAYANVQPHSGSQANLAVFFALLSPGDKVLSLDLAAGGHLSHGLGANLSGRWFEAHHYGVDRDTGLIDYDQVAAQARALRPKLLITGGSAYPRALDFARMAEIAREVGAVFMVDMAHIAGLVAGGVHPSPIPYADIVTCTTTKTLRGPRGGMILAREDAWGKKLQSSVFPGVQGSLHTQVLAAKAVSLGEALQPEFRSYARQVVENADTLCRVLQAGGIELVAGGTDTHVALLDLSTIGMPGRVAEALLDEAHITSNKNPIPFDDANPNNWAGLRLGVSAATTRGFRQAEFQELGRVIAELLTSDESNRAARLGAAQSVTARLCEAHPIYNS
ncbi:MULTISPECIES: serine hydroxymethyltransferase [unclassified Roseovarius]|uniref:serine hydroxymethyltransferase n=1 Tax=unclassified Roseovarius TaxID=2614913 RepID=UPI00273D9F99|nr:MULTISPECIES: serine hydroxymethyltransferase [unclassified Roseovarius]